MSPPFGSQACVTEATSPALGPTQRVGHGRQTDIQPLGRKPAASPTSARKMEGGARAARCRGGGGERTRGGRAGWRAGVGAAAAGATGAAARAHVVRSVLPLSISSEGALDHRHLTSSPRVARIRSDPINCWQASLSTDSVGSGKGEVSTAGARPRRDQAGGARARNRRRSRRPSRGHRHREPWLDRCSDLARVLGRFRVLHGRPVPCFYSGGSLVEAV